MVGSLPGLTSAPRFPHALQTKRGSRSENLTSSAHWSTTSRPRITLWLALCRQKTMRPRTPAARISPSVILTGRPSGKLRYRHLTRRAAHDRDSDK